MQAVLGRFSPQVYAIFRFVAGAMFAMHGAQKLLGWPPREGGGGGGMKLMSMMGVAGIIELVGGIMIAIGLFTSLAAFIASGEMAAAYFIAHAKGGAFPIQNGGELAVLYCFAFLFMAAHGTGIWSVDSGMRGPRGSRTT